MSRILFDRSALSTLAPGWKDSAGPILKERYEPRFRSLSPTKASELYLYGDRVSWGWVEAD